MSGPVHYPPDWLTGEVAPIAWCWQIVRRDGVTVGLTTHDAPINAEGLVYQPSPGMRPSAIHQRRGIGGDSFSIEGAVTATAISEAALMLGRWDGARISLSVVDWQQPEVRQLVIAEGVLGAVSSDGSTFTAELGARDVWFDAQLVPETSAECRAELGDAACRVAMAGRVHRRTVVAVDDQSVTIAGVVDDAAFAFGRLRWLDGEARGLSSLIVAQDGAVLTLAQCHEGAKAGHWVELTEGCDKRAATCSARFSNIANFRGEPHLPGIDLLTRFPGG